MSKIVTPVNLSKIKKKTAGKKIKTKEEANYTSRSKMTVTSPAKKKLTAGKSAVKKSVSPKKKLLKKKSPSSKKKSKISRSDKNKPNELINSARNNEFDSQSIFGNLQSADFISEYIATQIYQKTMQKLESDPKLKNLLSTAQKEQILNDEIKYQMSQNSFGRGESRNYQGRSRDNSKDNQRERDGSYNKSSLINSNLRASGKSQPRS